MIQAGLLDNISATPVNVTDVGHVTNSKTEKDGALFSKVMKLVNSKVEPEAILDFVEKEAKGMKESDRDFLFNMISEKMEGESGESSIELPKKAEVNEMPLHIEKEGVKLKGQLDQVFDEKIKVGKRPTTNISPLNIKINNDLESQLGLKENDDQASSLFSKHNGEVDRVEVKTERQSLQDLISKKEVKIKSENGSLIDDLDKRENSNLLKLNNKKLSHMEKQQDKLFTKTVNKKITSANDFLTNLNTVNKGGAEGPLVGKIKRNSFFKVSSSNKTQSISKDGTIKTSGKEFSKVKQGSVDPLKEAVMDSSVILTSKTNNEIGLVGPDGVTKIHEEVRSSNNNSQVKILNLSNIDSTNTNQLIEKISDYVLQSKVQNTDQLDLIVKHDSLGQFNIQVSKVDPSSELLDLKIVTATDDAANFFNKNEINLLKHLGQNGVKISDMKIAMSDSSGTFSSEFSNNDSSGNSSNSQNQFSSSQDGQFGKDSQRRRQLWQEYKERLGA